MSFVSVTLGVVVSTLLLSAAGPEDLLSDPKARTYVAEAEIMFAERRFAEAATMLERAYLIEPKSELLYPWAQAEREQGHCDVAVDLYRRFLASHGEGPIADNARGHIETCESELGVAGGAVGEDEEVVEVIDDEEELADEDELDALVEEEPESDPDPVPAKLEDEDPPKAKKWYLDPIGGVLTGVGLVGVGVGAALVITATSAADDAPDAASVTDYMDERDRATTMRNAGAAVLSVGGALLVGGVVRYLIVAKKNKATPTAAVWYVPGSGGVALSGRF